jgi:hypothetical protein
MNVLSVDFHELYRRHLCRHSKFGINVAHVVSLLGTYVMLGGLVYALAMPEWILPALIVPYLTILAFNIPLPVFLLNTLFLGMVLLTCWALPALPLWCYPLGIVVFYKLQAWSHRIYRREMDMTEFDRKYPKGFARFVLLSVYELPILLNYLFFGQQDWYPGSDVNSSGDGGSLVTTLGEKAGRHANGNDSATV